MRRRGALPGAPDPDPGRGAVSPRRRGEGSEPVPASPGASALEGSAGTSPSQPPPPASGRFVPPRGRARGGVGRGGKAPKPRPGAGAGPGDPSAPPGPTRRSGAARGGVERWLLPLVLPAIRPTLRRQRTRPARRRRRSPRGPRAAGGGPSASARPPAPPRAAASLRRGERLSAPLGYPALRRCGPDKDTVRFAGTSPCSRSCSRGLGAGRPRSPRCGPAGGVWVSAGPGWGLRDGARRSPKRRLRKLLGIQTC